MSKRAMAEIQHSGAKVEPEKFTFLTGTSFMPHPVKKPCGKKRKKFHRAMAVFNDI